MSNRIKVKEFGLDVLYRHDYDEERQGSNIAKYINKSCKYLEEFLTNVSGSDEYKTYWDIGCGNAQTLDYFENSSVRPMDCYGIDKHPQNHDDRIIKGDFYNLEAVMKDAGVPMPDVVMINHTLEHSLAPLLLEQLRKCHKIGGTLFIAVPDADYPWAYDITSSTTHWSIFNEGFMRTLLQRYGYECTVEKKCFRDNCGELFAVGVRRW